MAKAFDVYFDICGAQINSQVENNVFFLIWEQLFLQSKITATDF